MNETIKVNENRLLVLYSISTDVLIVASVSERIGDWSAYIGAATEFNHKEAALRVWHHGDKLDKRIAEIIFPELAEKYYWRD